MQFNSKLLATLVLALALFSAPAFAEPRHGGDDRGGDRGRGRGRGGPMANNGRWNEGPQETAARR
ncbi:hypothetical protein K488DRAFT_87357 [Vararia minispora EC-137]|uniref:Uncharacterized protein n=1 Tax=Vararia minispora EC-137 TaxID=1314806 RepID=A0ACB8QGS6_9AGAM|nr:hypothetical protein K488DRAFT_87357 [Vararia minispora EC-137]